MSSTSIRTMSIFALPRFRDEPRVTCIRNDGFTIPQVPPKSITMFYCFDAMVHFDSDVVRRYLAEIRRVLDPATGRAFLHHSNYTGRPGGDFHDSLHWRNFMSVELMAHYAAKAASQWKSSSRSTGTGIRLISTPSPFWAVPPERGPRGRLLRSPERWKMRRVRSGALARFGSSAPRIAVRDRCSAPELISPTCPRSCLDLFGA